MSPLSRHLRTCQWLDIVFIVSAVFALVSFVRVRSVYSYFLHEHFRVCFPWCYQIDEHLFEKMHIEWPTQFMRLGEGQRHLTSAWTVMTLTLALRIFKYFDCHPKLHMLSCTIFSAGEELMYFSFAFLILFSGYAVGGWLLLRGQMESFATVGVAFETVGNLVLLGEHQWAEMKAISPVAALLYFWTFLGEPYLPAPIPFRSFFLRSSELI